MKTKLQPSQKLSLKPALMYAFAGIIGAVLIGIGTFFYLSVGNSLPAKAAPGDIVRSVGPTNANWNDRSGWDIRIPVDGDRVVIQSGYTRLINANKNFSGEIIVNGALNVTNARLAMDANSKIAVNTGGIIDLSPPTQHWLFFIPYLRPTGIITIGGSNNYEIDYPWYFPQGAGAVKVFEDASGEISFGDGAESLLPIELVNFDAKMGEGQSVAITWSTASEENNDFFTVERSLDGKNYFTLDTIDGAGTSNSMKQYAYTDDLPAAGTNYYRLKQTDFDGKFEYFKIISVYNENNLTELEMVTIGPNPYRDHFKVNFFSGDRDSVHLKLMDMTGKTVFTKSLEAEIGSNSFIYHDEQNLKPGIYIFTIMQKGVPAKTFRIVKNS